MHLQLYSNKDDVVVTAHWTLNLISKLTQQISDWMKCGKVVRVFHSDCNKRSTSVIVTCSQKTPLPFYLYPRASFMKLLLDLNATVKHNQVILGIQRHRLLWFAYLHRDHFLSLKRVTEYKCPDERLTFKYHTDNLVDNLQQNSFPLSASFQFWTIGM